MKESLLLVNMGGPSRLEQVPPYMRKIFRDPAILPFPAWLRWPLAELISRRRSEKIAERYRKIGGASPLLSWTVKLRDNMVIALREAGLSHPVEFAFRYCEPSIKEGLSSLKSQGSDFVRVLPLFPHYTRAMTGSVLNEAKQAADSLSIRIQSVDAWGLHPEIIKLWREYLNQALATAGENARVLFVAHGIPKRNVRRGETYPEDVKCTAEAIVESGIDSFEWSFAFQSKIGPVKWTQPYLKDKLARFALSSEPLVVMPLSFAAECLETLYDLDIVTMEEAREKGIRTFVRVPAFNDDLSFARALVKVVFTAEGVHA
jgi:ferrochelatase